MCEKLVLERFDNSSWGFRLTGGLDFGTPLTVLKVIGGSIAELSGVKVGDLIVEINGKSAKNLTHTDAQNCIIESGNKLTLCIMRGSEVTPPGSTPLRGMTPLHGVEDYLLDNLSDSHSISYDQLNEKLEHFKRETKTTSLESGIDYSLESTKEFQSDEVSFMVENQEKTYSERGLDDVSDLEIAELLTGNEEVLDEGLLGINFKKYQPQVDFIRESEVFKLLQTENTHKEIPEQVQLQKDPEKRFSTFLMKPKPPPSPKPTGPYWHYPKAPRYLPRESEKPKEDPKRRIIREKGHTVLWLFLGESGEHVIDERWGTPEEERINLSRNENREEDQMSTSSQKEAETKHPKIKKVPPQSFSLDEPQPGRQTPPKFEATAYVENVADVKKQAFKTAKKTFAETVDYETSEEAVEQSGSVELVDDEAEVAEVREEAAAKESGQQVQTREKTAMREYTDESGLRVQESTSTREDKELVRKEVQTSEREKKRIIEETTKVTQKTVIREEYSGTLEGLAKITGRAELKEGFERKLAEIQEQIDALKGEAPSDLQSQLLEIREQLSRMVQMQSSSKHLTSEDNDTVEIKEEYSSQTEGGEYGKETAQEEYKYEGETEEVEEEDTEEAKKQVHENGDLDYETVTEEHKTVIEEYERGEYELCEVPAPPPSLAQERKKKGKQLLTPQPRPIVLPGGRMWRRPKDAAYDEFYQGVLVEQADVLVGSDVGVNFRKYIPPRFDPQNSAVARLIHELEEKAKGHEKIGPEDKYYYTPISKRHFYAASLPQPEPKGMVELEDIGTDV